ncbi:unnamed protein product [Triticum turgidum subsp. durum]|uniref:Gnk2-homologous domain-containing protein n=2 Tax=Triticum TaxID=4564 RepID=A0A9R1S471_TRITD|nr:unnamed protein product [Triticum aestivum]VAH80436.1 unnamed protein product [Triticum turgidum subsp. durum]
MATARAAHALTALTCALSSLAILAAILFTLLLLIAGPLQLRVPTSYAVVDCATPPTSSDDSAAAFRDSLLPLLAALPAAAAPTGFATLQSGAGAFARGFCLGGSAPRECLACLAAGAKNLTGCGASRRAGVWRAEGCFLSYADDNTSSAYEESFLQVVYYGEEVLPPDISFSADTSDPDCFEPRRLVALAESLARPTARARASSPTRPHSRATPLGIRTTGWWLDGEYVYVAADVVGYNCFLRIEATVPTVLRLAKYMSEQSFLFPILGSSYGRTSSERRQQNWERTPS